MVCCLLSREILTKQLVWMLDLDDGWVPSVQYRYDAVCYEVSSSRLLWSYIDNMAGRRHVMPAILYEPLFK